MSYYYLISMMPKAPAFDPDAQAFITAAGITDPTQQTAINNLVVGMKADGVWTKMKAIYPFVGGTASTHKWNLKDPRDLDAAFRLQFVGRITHSSTGALPFREVGEPGYTTTGYANTFFAPSIQISNPDSFHFSFYSRTDTSQYNPVMGARDFTIGGDGDGGETEFNENENSIRLSNALNSFPHGFQSSGGFTDTNSLGFYVTNRNLIVDYTVFKNGVLKRTKVDTAGSARGYMLLMGLSNTSVGNPLNSFYATAQTITQIAFATLGTGLTNTDNTNLYNRIQTFQTALSRQV